jgi:hypothetical protein
LLYDIDRDQHDEHLTTLGYREADQSRSIEGA